MADTVIEYPRDANGVQIKPGYRKPFDSESGRAAGIKGARATALAWRELKNARDVLFRVHDLLKARSKKSTISTRSPNKDSSQVKPGPSEIAPINPATGKPLL